MQAFEYEEVLKARWASVRDAMKLTDTCHACTHVRARMRASRFTTHNPKVFVV